MTPELTTRDRAEGALWGLLLGDALAMPVHWYYDRQALRRDYGEVRDLLAPRNPHPGSILHRSHYAPADPDADILHDQARYWGQPGIHYHQHLEAGENTLNLLLVQVLLADLAEHGRYDADRYLERMIAFVRDPGSHRDTYVEEWLAGSSSAARGAFCCANAASPKSTSAGSPDRWPSCCSITTILRWRAPRHTSTAS